MKTKKYLILNISIVAICIMLISSCKGDLSKKVGGVFQSKYESKEGKFKIKFPKEPKVSSEKYPSAVGEISVNTFMHEETPNNIFTVVYADYPAGILKGSDNSAQKVLNGAKDGALKSFGNCVVDSQKDIEVNGHPGILFKAHSDNNAFIIYQLILVDDRLYQVNIYNEKEYAKQDIADKFINSFEITE
jgi:hypothetical protein